MDTWFGIATAPAIAILLYNETSILHSLGRELSNTQCSSGAGGFNGSGGVEWMSRNLNFDNDPYTIDASLAHPDEATRQSHLSAPTSLLNLI